MGTALLDRGDLPCLLGLLAFVLFFFHRAVFGGEVLFARDIALVWYPQVSSFIRSVGAGSWPLWDPYRGFGQPLLADPSAMLLYPFTWLNLVVPPGAFYTAFVVFHVAGSAWGTYALLRRWEASRAASFVGAAVWAANGPFLSLGSLWHHLAGAAWMPWIFLAAEEAVTRPSRGRTVRFGLAVAAQLLAGSADMAAFTHLALAACLLARHFDWGQVTGAANRRLLRTWTAAFLLGVGLSCVQWVPAIGMVLGSARSDLALWHRTTWSLPPLGLVEVFLPVLWGTLPRVSADVQDTFDLQVTWLHSLYFGIPVLALVSAGLLARRGGRLLALLSAGALLYALGRHSIVYAAFTFLIPPLRVLRFPVKAMLVVAFAWSLLAGLGYDVWRRAAGEGRRFWTVVFLPAAVLALACLGATLVCTFGAESWGPYLFYREPGQPSYTEILTPVGDHLVVATVAASLLVAVTFAAARWRGRPGQPPAFAAALALGSLALQHTGLHPTVSPDLYTIRPEVVDVLRRTSATPRIYAYDYTEESQKPGRPGARKIGYLLERVPVGWTNQQGFCLGLYLYLQPPTAGRYGFYGSYDLDLLGLHPKARAELIDRLHALEASPLHLRMLRMGSVDYVLALYRAPWWDDLRAVATVPGVFKEPMRVFAVPDPLPRAYVVGGARVAPGPEASLRAVTAAGFDLRREVVLDSGSPRAAPEGFVGRSRIVESRPDRVRFVAEASHPGFAVLVDAYDPGWRATVDGSPAAVERANVDFRAVAVPAGEHVVELTYRPPSVALGLVLAAATVVAGAACWRWPIRSRAPEASEDPVAGAAPPSRDPEET
ncbi:MAG TPA: YfhO family protein [Vicinamibacteria bacterium]|nr:YfhO family protein [Vicinamibacteria bacterium]